MATKYQIVWKIFPGAKGVPVAIKNGIISFVHKGLDGEPSLFDSEQQALTSLESIQPIRSISTQPESRIYDIREFEVIPIEESDLPYQQRRMEVDPLPTFVHKFDYRETELDKLPPKMIVYQKSNIKRLNDKQQ